MPDNTAQGGLRHDPPRDWERTSHLSRQHESDDHLRSHSMCRCLTTRLDNEEILDGILSRMDEIVEHLDEAMTEVMRRAEEIHIDM